MVGPPKPVIDCLALGLYLVTARLDHLRFFTRQAAESSGGVRVRGLMMSDRDVRKADSEDVKEECWGLPPTFNLFAGEPRVLELDYRASSYLSGTLKPSETA